MNRRVRHSFPTPVSRAGSEAVDFSISRGVSVFPVRIFLAIPLFVTTILPMIFYVLEVTKKKHTRMPEMMTVFIWNCPLAETGDRIKLSCTFHLP